MMHLITAASPGELAREIADTAMRLGRQGAVCETVIYQEIITGRKGHKYWHYEVQLHYHWAAIDEATHRPGMRQQQSVGGAG